MGQKQTTIHKNLSHVEIQDDQENWLVNGYTFPFFCFGLFSYANHAKKTETFIKIFAYCKNSTSLHQDEIQ